jgi:1-acyl-sn-glycerol-3-phosphate acyltransferase
MSLRSLYYLPLYYGTLLLFALAGLEISALGLLCSWLPTSDRSERFFQRLIHQHYRIFHWWCATVNLVHVRYHGFERLPTGGAVFAVNHVSLIDITCLIARLPEACCIFKPAIRHNPILGAAARRAGYLGADGGHELVRRAVNQVEAGHRLVIFPEGTRALRGEMRPFKPGFVLIARRAQVPVQLIRIETDSDLLTKSRAILALPHFPAHVDVTVGPLVATNTVVSTVELSARIEKWFRGGPGGPPLA